MTLPISTRFIYSVFGLLLCAGCASADSPRMTIEQYVEETCGIRIRIDLIESDLETWGDWADLIHQDRLAPMLDVIPPAGLEQYHQARLASYQAQYDVLKDKPRDKSVSAFEVIGVFTASVLEESGTETNEFYKLPEDIRDQLSAGECTPSDNSQEN